MSPPAGTYKLAASERRRAQPKARLERLDAREDDRELVGLATE